MNCNIRSYNRNFDNFDLILKSFSELPNAFTLCETWFNSNSVLPQIYESYDIFHTVRCVGKGGGVSVYVDRKYSAVKIHELSICNDHIETCCVKLNSNCNLNIVLISVYRPPNSSPFEFISILLQILNNFALNNDKILISGDFNLNILNENSSTRQLKFELQSLGFISVISKPTRFDPNPDILPTLLDHIWINFFHSFSCGIIFSDVTDHCPTFLLISSNSPKPIDNINRKIVFRDHCENNLNNFLYKVSLIDWDSLLVGSVDQMLKIFETKINNIYFNECPLKSKILSGKRLVKPWISTEVLKHIKTKSYYFKLYKLGIIDHQLYKSYKNYLSSFLRNAKKNIIHLFLEIRIKTLNVFGPPLESYWILQSLRNLLINLWSMART